MKLVGFYKIYPLYPCVVTPIFSDGSKQYRQIISKEFKREEWENITINETYFLRCNPAQASSVDVDNDDAAWFAWAIDRHQIFCQTHAAFSIIVSDTISRNPSLIDNPFYLVDIAELIRDDQLRDRQLKACALMLSSRSSSLYSKWLGSIDNRSTAELLESRFPVATPALDASLTINADIQTLRSLSEFSRAQFSQDRSKAVFSLLRSIEDYDLPTLVNAYIRHSMRFLEQINTMDDGQISIIHGHLSRTRIKTTEYDKEEIRVRASEALRAFQSHIVSSTQDPFRAKLIFDALEPICGQRDGIALYLTVIFLLSAPNFSHLLYGNSYVDQYTDTYKSQLSSSLDIDKIRNRAEDALGIIKSISFGPIKLG